MRASHLLRACAWPPCLVLFSACASSSPTMRLHFIDVGQGAATLVELPCAAVLVDTGGESNPGFSSNAQLGAYLDRFFDSRPDLSHQLDLLLLTHPHIDHTRGVKLVLERFRPKKIVTNGREEGSGRHGQIAAHRFEGAQLEHVRVSRIPPGGYTSPVVDGIDCDAVDPELRVLWGGLEDDANETNGNNHSVVLRIGFGRASALLTGDLESKMIAALLERHRHTSAVDVDVYQVGHHGSNDGTTPELLAAMSPTIAVVNVGPPDREHMWTAWAFGHPRATVVRSLEASLRSDRPAKRVLVGLGSKRFEPMIVSRATFATGWDGNVVLEASIDGAWRVVSRAD